MLLLPRDLPKHECIKAIAERHPGVEPSALESYLWLLRLASDVVAVCERYFDRFGLSQARFTVLMLLRRAEAIAAGDSACAPAGPAPGDQAAGASSTPSDLADKCGVSRATMTGLLDGLERDGHVARERPMFAESGDRRSVAVRLTDKGRRHLDSILPGYFSLIGELMKGLTDTQREQLASLLRQLRAGSPVLAEAEARSAPELAASSASKETA